MFKPEMIDYAIEKGIITQPSDLDDLTDEQDRRYAFQFIAATEWPNNCETFELREPDGREWVWVRSAPGLYVEVVP